MSWMDRLDRLTDRHAELTDLLSRGNLDAKRFQSVSRELADLDGKVAAALMGKADELFSEPPQIHKFTLLAAK